MTAAAARVTRDTPVELICQQLALFVWQWESWRKDTARREDDLDRACSGALEAVDHLAAALVRRGILPEGTAPEGGIAWPQEAAVDGKRQEKEELFWILRHQGRLQGQLAVSLEHDGAQEVRYWQHAVMGGARGVLEAAWAAGVADPLVLAQWRL